ncbi:MAG: T9SS type A sorting domain-containing protein, partial [Bacteroidales bacterium]|nr:T9SS type A sorting domain-containing protein [Bacteroidales bacterium]
LLIGNYAGGVSLFLGSTPLPHGTSIPQPAESFFQVYPNPTTGMVQCLPEQEVSSLELFDLSGRRLLQTRRGSLDLSSFANGLYILVINHHTRIKIIKQ